VTFRLAFLILAGLTSVACAKGDNAADANASKSPPIAAAVPDPHPDPAAPDSFRVAFRTGKGEFVVQVSRAWAPRGADRFHALVTSGYFDKVKFFRVIDGFMAQFGINGDPKVNEQWGNSNMPDDSVRQSNVRGAVSFAAQSSPHTRSTQLFINYGDNVALDRMRFAPFGKVVSGMDVVDKLYKEYGEGAPSGLGPEQGRIEREGNAYLNKSFPKLDSIISARVIK
jgi:peptidyl-prolyl cis-trans isomerase A (cyclophilin A)